MYVEWSVCMGWINWGVVNIGGDYHLGIIHGHCKSIEREESLQNFIINGQIRWKWNENLKQFRLAKLCIFQTINSISIFVWLYCATNEYGYAILLLYKETDWNLNIHTCCLRHFLFLLQISGDSDISVTITKWTTVIDCFLPLSCVPFLSFRLGN